jgi:hypothetical protein
MGRVDFSLFEEPLQLFFHRLIRKAAPAKRRRQACIRQMPGAQEPPSPPARFSVPNSFGKQSIESPNYAKARQLKKRLDDSGIAAEIVAPRLWFHLNTIDGAYTSNNPKAREYAIERSLRSIDIANVLGTDILVLGLAREGSYIREV